MTVREMRDRLFHLDDQTIAVRRVLPAYAKYTASPNETVEQMRHRLFNLEPQDGPIEKAKDVTDRRARLHRALDAVLDRRVARDDVSTEQVLKSVGFKHVGRDGDNDNWERGLICVSTSRSTDEWWFYPGGWDEGGRAGKGASQLKSRL